MIAPTPLAHGFCFGEGPRWFEGLLWFSDMLGEAVHTSTMAGSLTTLPLPGHSPSGLGFRPDGALLIASAEDRLVLRYDGETVVPIADLSELAPANLGDMVIDDAGRAYIGAQAFQGGTVIRLDPDDSATVVAADLDFPNGMVITPDGQTLILAESIGRRLTAFTIDPDTGSLRQFGASVPIRARPIHISVDSGGNWLLTAYNLPSAMSVHPLDSDGAIGAEVKQAAAIDCGIYAHQVRMMPANRSLVLVTRGNDATAAKPEDPQLKMPLIGVVRRAEPAPPKNKRQRTKKPIQPKLADL